MFNMWKTSTRSILSSFISSSLTTPSPHGAHTWSTLQRESRSLWVDAFVVLDISLIVWQSGSSITVKLGKGDEPQGFVTVSVKDYQNLKAVEDRVSDVVLCLDSTLDTLNTFLEAHQRRSLDLQGAEQSRPQASDAPKSSDAILYVLKEKQREVTYTRKKAEALLAKTQNTRALVSCVPITVMVC
jgi:hypothetical protein